MNIKKAIYILILAIILGLPNSSMALPPFDPSYYISQIIHGNVGRPLYLLTVTGSGDGTGTITSNVYGINCTSTVGVESGNCSVQVPMGTTVVLTATATTGVFNGWSGGGCLGTGTCSVLIDGNKTIDASFIVLPQAANLIGWYKVDEGAGGTLINSAPPSIHKFPDLNTTIPGAGFWTTHAGFGYWDGATTVVNNGFVNTGPLTGNITVMLFGRNERPACNDVYNMGMVQIRPGNAAFMWEWTNNSVNRMQPYAGVDSANVVDLFLNICADWLSRDFVWAFRANGATRYTRRKYTTPLTGWQSNTAAGFATANGPVTSIHVGYDNVLPAPDKTYMGIIGDILIWNSFLTDAEVDAVVTALGPRWGF